MVKRAGIAALLAVALVCGGRVDALTATAVPAAVHRSARSYGAWGAGYIAHAPSGKRFTEASVTFVVPRQAPRPPRRGVAWVGIWVGIGVHAVGGSQLMQAGVYLATEAGRRGWRLEVPWWVNEPARPQRPHTLMLNVEPGDRIAVRVRQSEGDRDRWHFTVRDLTSNRVARGECRGCESTARAAGWIVEDPAGLPYANPGRVRFQAASAALNGGKARSLVRLAPTAVLRKTAQGGDGPTKPQAGSGAFVVGRVRQRPLGTVPQRR